MGRDDDATSDDLQELPARAPRRRGQYVSVKPPAENPSITNVGGYDILSDTISSTGLHLTRDQAGLSTLDSQLESAPSRFKELGRDMGMFYGDVLTHTLVGSHWVVRDDTRPEVRITETVTVDVVGVGLRRIEAPHPSLVENLRHVLEIAATND